MKRALVCWLLVAGTALAADDAIDRFSDALAWSSPDGAERGRLSGIVDLEEYALPVPPPGVISTTHSSLFNPRLSLFFDGQVGENLYAFAQARLDRGFDTSSDGQRARLDEYALRWSVGRRGAFDIQVGKFGTVFGNWVSRHDSWQNPFITAPLPYETLTGVWDNEPVHSGDQLLVWSHVRPGLPSSFSEEEKYLQLPIIWGPSYATGAAVAGSLSRFRYAVEVKNASLSSRPDAWSPRESGFDHPTVSGRVRYVPDQQWEFGLSASSGAFLRPAARSLLAPSIGRAHYRENVVGGDISYAWHHLQVWAEAYAARFVIPRVGDADVFSYYVEARYKFTPELSGAVRWGQQTYGTIATSRGAAHWDHDVWRIDFAPMWRLSAHAQVKVQYSIFRTDQFIPRTTDLVAAQLTMRF
jgi:hypothetical protein